MQSNKTHKSYTTHPKDNPNNQTLPFTENKQTENLQ